MSAGGEQQYLCDGMAEDLINALTHVDGLRVVARTSAFSIRGKGMDIREIGRRLNVKTLLEGSVQRAGERLRITAKLVNVADGYHIWSERYDSDMGDLFAVQDKISLAIVGKLKVKLLGEERARLMRRYTQDPQAYNLYLKGRHFQDKSTAYGFKKSIEYFGRAIERDPDYALSYAGLADTYTTQGFYDHFPPSDVFPEAKAAALRALEIEPTLAEAHTSLGMVRLYEWDWDGAGKALRRAIELSPNFQRARDSYAFYLMVLGKMDEATIEAERSVEMDPLSVTANMLLGVMCLRAKHVVLAREQFRKAVELDTGLVQTRCKLGQTYVIEGQHDKGLAEMERALELSGNQTLILADLGWAYAVSGRRAKALEVLEALKAKTKDGYVGPHCFARVYSGLSEIDLAFEWLDRAFEEHDVALFTILTDETLEGIRSDPRYPQLLKKMGLTE
jgi:TolB-like protein/tetratricopeptide (TPR) repeat protein